MAESHGLLTSPQITNVSQLVNDSGYLTDAGVRSIVTSYGYQTDASVRSIVTSYGYQTADQASAAAWNQLGSNGLYKWEMVIPNTDSSRSYSVYYTFSHNLNCVITVEDDGFFIAMTSYGATRYPISGSSTYYARICFQSANIVRIDSVYANCTKPFFVMYWAALNSYITYSVS